VFSSKTVVKQGSVYMCVFVMLGDILVHWGGKVTQMSSAVRRALRHRCQWVTG